VPDEFRPPVAPVRQRVENVGVEHEGAPDLPAHTQGVVQGGVVMAAHITP
jgi:hypothetical protein